MQNYRIKNKHTNWETDISADQWEAHAPDFQKQWLVLRSPSKPSKKHLTLSIDPAGKEPDKIIEVVVVKKDDD